MKKFLAYSVAASAIAGMIMTASVASAAGFHYTLTIPNLQGSTPTSIDLDSFGWGVTNSASIGTGTGGGAGKANFSDFTFTAKSGSASPALVLADVTGKHLLSATLAITDNKGNTLFTIEMNDALVSSYQMGASHDNGDRAPEDSVSLDFAKIKITTPGDQTTGGVPVSVGWDIQQNVGF